jgi:ABC-type multidrug transport system ATPase subunit
MLKSGANGAGKTTLLRLLAGITKPDGGRLITGSTVRPAFLSQELRELPGHLRLLEAVEEVAKRVKLGDRELSAGQLAEVFGFTDKRIWTPVSDLSGGERRRLQMLRLLATEPNVLLLDEPTNDLDTDTLASLEDLLDSWPGTMIVASHDRYLVERVTDGAYGMFGDGRLVHLPGGIDEYLARVHGTAPAVPEKEPQAAQTATGLSSGDLRQARKDLARLERQMDKLTDREAKINESLAVHGSDYDKLVELETQLKAVKQEREQVEQAWLELAEQVPGN